jgi:hypothetical protein
MFKFDFETIEPSIGFIVIQLQIKKLWNNRSGE